MTEPNQEWQAPPLPEEPQLVEEKEVAQMSEIATLGNIFLEPGRTFEDLRRQPRFIFGMLIMVVLITGFAFLFQQRMGEERYRRSFAEMIEKNPQAGQMSPEQKKGQIEMQVTISKYSAFIVPVVMFIVFFVGGLIYWLGGKAMGGTMSYLHGLSVWVYSSFPITVVSILANILVLYLKSPDDIDIATSQRGLVNANPSMFFDGKEMPVLTTLISTIDVFAIWGLILAAIGLRIVGKISSGSAWAIVLILSLVGVTFRVVGALLSGAPS